MITDTSKRIQAYIKINHQARPVDLVRHLGISQVALHRQLGKLLASNLIARVGAPPRVFYTLAVSEPQSNETPQISPTTLQTIEANYFYTTPNGELITGWGGFTAWAKQTHQILQLPTLSEEYVSVLSGLERYRTLDGLIDATEKVSMTFGQDNAIDRLYYADFYSLPKFGKTRLGHLVINAKLSQNISLISQLVSETKPLVEKIISKHKIHAIAFIPPSIPRKIQLQKEYQRLLSLTLPKINLIKVRTGQIVVAQKSLAKLEERIINAHDTIVLPSPQPTHDKILLIDDAVGSGSTFNETAKKLKSLGLAKEVIGFAIVGSLKGFEIIKEV